MLVNQQSCPWIKTEECSENCEPAEKPDSEDQVSFHHQCQYHLHHFMHLYETDEIDNSDRNSDRRFYCREWIVADHLTRKLRAPRQNEFLYLLLENFRYASYATWLNKSQGLFKIYEPEHVATLWKRVKCRQTTGVMDYETFARGIRYYYKSGLMIKTHRQYTYRFRL